MTGTPEITIPADFLEDMRSALVVEIHLDSDAVHVNHQEALEDGGGSPGREDRASAVRILRADMNLLDQVLEASDDTLVTGEADAMVHALEAVIRVLTPRLGDECQYGPLDLGAVLELTRRLRWAAEEAARIDGLDEQEGGE